MSYFFLNIFFAINTKNQIAIIMSPNANMKAIIVPPIVSIRIAEIINTATSNIAIVIINITPFYFYKGDCKYREKRRDI